MAMCLMSSCAISPNAQPFVKPVTILVVKKIVDKKPGNADKIAKLLDKFDLLADTATKGLTLQDFLNVAKEVDIDSDWAIFASSLYDIYKVKLENEKVETAAKALKDAVQYVREILLIVKPSK